MDAALGVGVAVVAVLFTVWLVAAVVSSPNSRFTSLDAAVNRSDILHSIDSILPQAPSIFGDLQTFLNDQGFPQVFSSLTPPSTPNVSTPTNAQTRSLADPAVFSTVKILGMACSNEQEGSGFVVGKGLVATNAHVVAGEGGGNTQVLVGNNAYNATPVFFDPEFDLAVLRTSAPLGPALTISPDVVARGTQAAILGYPEDGGLSIGPAGVTEEIEAIGKDIYNSSSVTARRLRPRRHRPAGQLGRAPPRPRWPGHRGRVLALDRLSQRGLRPHLPGRPGPGPAGRNPARRGRNRTLHLRLRQE